ncbi:MAG: hypothetical protein B7Z55_01940 [Planctomycetales bacterium 12-60-4]|nr:MAG: hypothetical protein B7Z55_01940 [Planctomycetales bacterium 12-60-4]
MSFDDRFDRRDEVDPADIRPVKKEGGCWKWVLIFGAVGFVCVLLCCGVGGFMMYRMAPKVVNQPADVAAMAQEISDIDIPETFVGKAGINMNLGFMSMKMCMFEHTEGQGVLQLMEMQVKIGDPKDGEAQLRQQMRQQGNAEIRGLNIEKSETREYEIRGEKASFTFAEGKDIDNGTPYREVKGSFRGKTGVAVLQLQLQEEAWDEEEIEQLVESIH